jgi:hypothetical protein
MPQPKATKTRLPSILDDKQERIIDLLRLVGCATEEDIRFVLFRDHSPAYTRSILAKLSGGHDFAESEFLFRYPVPSTAKGTKRKAYALGTRVRELQAVEDAYRPSKARYLSYNQTWHNLSLTRFVCSALVLCETHRHVRLADIRLCYELARELAKVETEKDALLPPVPDAWINLELLDQTTGAHKTYLPSWLEIDMSTMYRLRFKQHVEDRIEYIDNGKYENFFGTNAVRIAYATISSRIESRDRLSAMRRCTEEVITDLKLEKWQSVFYFTSLIYEDLYTLKHFTDQVWFTPGDPTPKTLLEQ